MIWGWSSRKELWEDASALLAITWTKRRSEGGQKCWWLGMGAAYLHRSIQGAWNRGWGQGLASKTEGLGGLVVVSMGAGMDDTTADQWRLEE